MVSFLPNGDMHVITHANGFQFYVLPAKAVNLPANQVTVRSGGHQSLLQQWPVLAGSRLFQEDFSQGAVVSGFEDFGGGDDQHSQRVAFLFSPWIRYRFDTLLPASAGEDGVEVFPRLAGEQGIYLVNSGAAQTLYWLEDQGGLTKVKRVEYDTDTGRFEILAVSAICRGGGGGGEQVVQLLKEPRGAPPPCARSPAEFGAASNGLTSGFATTGQFQGQGPVVETFYLFGAKSVLIFAHNQRLVVRSLGEFFKVVDGGGGGGGSSVSPSGKSSKLDPVTAILIVVGLSVLFAAVIILVGIIYCSCCACSSPSPSSSSSSTAAAATKASSSSSGAKGSAQAKHSQQKPSSKQSKKEKAEKEEEEKEKTAMETAVETAATVESEEEASAALEDQLPPPPSKAKKRSAFAGKVGFLKSTSKELVRKQQKQQQAERASEMLPFSLTNTALSSLQTDALPVGKLSELVDQPLKQPLKQLKQKRPKQKQPKQQQPQLSVTTRSRSAGKGKSRSRGKSRGKSARPKSARGKTVLAGKQQPWPATATILTTAEEDQPTVLMAPPHPKGGKGGKVGRRGSPAHFFSSDSDVSTTRRSKSKAKSNAKKGSKGGKKKGPKTSKNTASSSAAAATEPVAETILTAREKVVVVVVDKSSGGKSKSKAKGKGKGGGGGGSRNTSSSTKSSSSSSDGGK
ncbi:hypothetical protein TYRP_020605 [Tyrophagus putrescentiae]|nr:hypothetical protein TYRP_020605 [Tyrophagus putrescentiae]